MNESSPGYGDRSLGGTGGRVLTSLDGRVDVRAAALLDESGRVLERLGFSDRDTLSFAAPLMTVLHTTGQRLGTIIGGGDGSPGQVYRIALSVGSDSVLLEPVLMDGAPWILFVVLEGAGTEDSSARLLQPVVQAIRAEYGGWVGIPGSVEFEASLLENLDRVLSGGRADGSGDAANG